MQILKKIKGRLKPIVAGAALSLGVTLGGASYAYYCPCLYLGVQVEDLGLGYALLYEVIGFAFHDMVETSVLGLLEMHEKDMVQALDAQVRVDVRNKADSAIKTETQLANAATAVIQAKGAIAMHEQQRAAADQMRVTRDKLTQPITTCLSVVAGGNLPSSSTVARHAASKATAGNLKVMERVAMNMRAAEENYAYVTQAFCSENMARRGVCSKVVDKKIVDGDIRAGLLFGDEQGSLTRHKDQESAVRASIERLTGVRNAPAELSDPVSEKTAQGKLYVETRRDYEAVSQLASACLNRASMRTRAQAGLGQLLKSAGLSADQVPDDISEAQAQQLYIQAQLSPSRIKDLAGATEPEVLLRSLTQNRNFNLMMQNARLETSECEEAMAAAQLALQARHLADKALAQGQAARLVSGN